ncbi:ATP-binding protein [Rubricoccus marinus]|uniref:Helicase HerA central domain-containing protein n=1 Tax=Rubricoccus marinus TaxID=716817 RepID=A0A259U3H4_9BACT|nr:DUF87 domain-containing protein [Rubricoccus marinus]OZC04559.1 hypothetical protein BSZ36_02715 [Rubricoccus marinus]
MPDAPAPFEGLGVFYLGKEVVPASGAPEPSPGKSLGAPVLYDSTDLTTHAFIVGMTGSGKTGLGVGLIEEAALDGIPVIAIDPKGDLGNLTLTFPDLSPESFRPWIDEGEATREGVTPEALAEQKAGLWRSGLEAWGQNAGRVARLQDAADVTIYTPGSDAGVQVSVLGSLDPPPPEARSGEASVERVDATVGGLLTLLGVEADAMSSPEHVFLAKVIGDAWAAGTALTLADLIGALQSPPFEAIGVMAVDDFFPARSRTALAMKLNGLLASPGFAAWAQGEPLDADRLFYGASGKPQVSVMSIAHLGDEERMFFVTRLLGEVLAWMRRQPGTGSLRAILYMDEIFGYLPPTANPASKQLLLTLLKQARAFGLGIVLATQNPVDMDYKALSNCGTWFVGRLQTERDKDRLLDGLEGAASGGFNRAEVDALLSGIGKRRFLLHNVHESAPVVMETRWVLNYLAGPLTRTQIGTLMAEQKEGRKEEGASGGMAAAAPEAAPVASPHPQAPSAPEASGASGPPSVDVPQVYLAGSAPDEYVPMLLARAEIPFERKSLDIEHTERVTLLTEIAGGEPQWNAAEMLTERPATQSAPEAGAAFAALPEGVDASGFARWEKSLKKWLQQERPLTVYTSKSLKASSRPGEDERAFRIRLQTIAHEARDEQKAALRKKYQSKLDALEKRMRSAQDAIDREQSQASQRKTDTFVRIGTTLLGAFLGNRSARSTMSAVGVTARSAGRMSKEKADVARAEQKHADLQNDYAELETQLQREMDGIDLSLDPTTEALDTTEVTATQTSMHVAEMALAWAPYRRDADGRRVRA